MTIASFGFLYQRDYLISQFLAVNYITTGVEACKVDE